jgi:hypothetical protein
MMLLLRSQRTAWIAASMNIDWFLALVGGSGSYTGFSQLTSDEIVTLLASRSTAAVVR